MGLALNDKSENFSIKSYVLGDLLAILIDSHNIISTFPIISLWKLKAIGTRVFMRLELKKT